MGLSSEELVRVLELPSNASLPPTISAWGKRARAVGVELGDVLDVHRGSLGGKPRTTYRLTSAALATLEKKE